MATGSVSFTAWVLVLALFTSFVPPRACSARKGLSRNKRATCADGEYTFNGRPCCRCAAGQFLVKDCVNKPNDTSCSFCQEGTYNSDPNNKKTCEPCTSCDQPHANLEVDEPCTSARNTKCKCREGNYCESEPCVVCQRCQECNEGVKSPCTATHDTVCSESPTTIIVVIIIVLVLLVAAAAGGFVYWKKRQNHQSVPDSDPAEEDLPLVELYPHLHEIAETIGWRTMENLAMCSRIKPATIESCKLNHPNDSQTQTRELLQTWTEKQGRGASTNLIRMLNVLNMRDKAEKVKTILRKEYAAAANHSV